MRKLSEMRNQLQGLQIASDVLNRSIASQAIIQESIEIDITSDPKYQKFQKYLQEKFKGDVSVFDLSYTLSTDEKIRAIQFNQFTKSVLAYFAHLSEKTKTLVKPKIKSLFIQYSSLNDTDVKSLVEFFQKVEIEEIDLRNNNIGPHGCRILAVALSQASKSVKTISLAFNNIGLEGVKALSLLINGKYQPVSFLKLTGCSLKPESMIEVAKLVESNPDCLTTLELNFNELDVNAAISWAKALINNTFLQHLNFESSFPMKNSDEVAQIIATAMKANKTLAGVNFNNGYGHWGSSQSSIFMDMVLINDYLLHFNFPNRDIGTSRQINLMIKANSLFIDAIKRTEMRVNSDDILRLRAVLNRLKTEIADTKNDFELDLLEQRIQNFNTVELVSKCTLDILNNHFQLDQLDLHMLKGQAQCQLKYQAYVDSRDFDRRDPEDRVIEYQFSSARGKVEALDKLISNPDANKVHSNSMVDDGDDSVNIKLINGYYCAYEKPRNTY